MTPTGFPSGVVTFLFTDIEGSTRRWEADPEAMRAALAVHDETLRTAIETHGGFLFKHTGDGTCAVFTSPKAAVDAAITAQQNLELPVRMGISTGEAELRGSDYFGPVLNRAARVMAAGHGGQVLLTDSTVALLTGVDLIELGSRRLRDLSTPVGVFQVRAEGLRSEFPPLRALDTPLGNLRPAATRLIGREAELDEVAAAVREHQVVTLTGVGGVGKTRLALEVAGRLGADFPEGVWLVELAPLGDPSAVPEVVAATLGIVQQPGKTLTQSVAEALEGRSRLLIFDNCEHVLDAAAELIESVLAGSRTVRILATSREGLRVSDEQLWPVPSLDVDAGINSSAAELFLQRAKAVSPGTQLRSDSDKAAIVEICKRLDGIPLAIELAASRMLSMTAAEVRDRLDDRFQLLVGSRRGLERHQTLRHAVQWSYDLLEEAEQTLLNRCSVFAGGFDLPGACAVAGIDSELTTLDLLDSLVRKSLIVADRSSGHTRYAMLETIRQFAEEQLVQRGGAADARSAHARYFASREDDVMAKYNSPEQREILAWFVVEFANLREAFRWAVGNNGLETALPIAIYAAFLGDLMQQLEPVAWAEELIEAARTAEHRRLPELYTMASQCSLTGRIAEFREYADAVEAMAESGSFDPVPDYFEAEVASGYLALGQAQECVDLCRSIIDRSPGRHDYARACLVIGLTLAGSEMEAIAESTDFPARADAESRHGNAGLAAFMLYAYGYAHRDVQPSKAYEALETGLRIARDCQNRSLEAALLVSLARLAATQREPSDAFEFLTQGIRLYHDSGNFLLTTGPLAILAALLHRLGHFESAAVIGHFADNPFTRLSYPEIKATVDQLAEELGSETYRALAAKAADMTNAEIVAYAYGQIDQAQAELLQDGESP